MIGVFLFPTVPYPNILAIYDFRTIICSSSQHPFRCLKRGETLTYTIGQTLTYGSGVTQTDFEGLATAMMCILHRRKGWHGGGR